MKQRTKPTLNAVDLRNIRVIVQTESLSSNREVRKELARLRKENAKLRKQKEIDNAIMADGAKVIAELRFQIEQERRDSQ